MKCNAFGFILLCCVTTVVADATHAAERRVDFNRDIKPILADTCYTCHGPDANTRKAKLRLDARHDAFADRDGIRLVVPGSPEKSELYLRITTHELDDRMPPVKSTRTLNKKQIALVRKWIEQGAEWEEQWWAFVPPKRSTLPKVSDADWPRNAIDHFVLAKLDREGLKPSPSADKITLIRRVTHDLTGLPPTPQEVETFIKDDSPNAFEKVVDRLLQSPRYGEHMASFWLDSARYADTDGYQNDRYRYQWVWRDWVIMALNDNMPFDQFVIEQLAGDMLPNATLKQQIATGFNRNHRINSEAGSIADEWHVENVVDRVDTFGTVFLGLTIQCARCHDHKYDPISQEEYYRLFAYFNNVPEFGIGPNNGNSPPFITVPKSWPNLEAGEDKKITPGKLEFQKNSYSGGVVRPKPGNPSTVMVMEEMKKPRPTYLLRRGQYNMPDKSKVLKPSVPESVNVSGGQIPANRLSLAKWLVHPSNPLTARVTVNRYWQRFFGVGLVKTSENFGTQGEPPSHPELLDWLATEFIRLKWDVKALHKVIVMSATYRQSSRISESMAERDPDNRLLARGPRFRLSAFALRDQALFASGLLVEKLYGESAKPYMPPKIWRSISNNTYKQDHGDNLYRRSLYTYWRRTIPPPTMANFNAGEREVCIVRKDKTNTPLQALTLMNNIAFVEASRFLAERMLRDGGDNVGGQIAYGFQLATGRKPNGQESRLLAHAHQLFSQQFEGNDGAAAALKLLSVGEKPRDKTLDPGKLAAMTMVGSTILNLDETITKE